MSELQAAMGIAQLKHLDEIILQRQQLRDSYADALIPLGFKQQAIDSGCSHNVQSAVFKVPDHVNRNQLIEKLKRQAIETTIGTYCQSGLPYYKAKYQKSKKMHRSFRKPPLPLPCYQAVPWEMVCEQIEKWFRF